jgi:hypothetical protein
MTRTYPIRGSEQQAISIPNTSPDVAITNYCRVLPGSARATGVGEIAASGDEVVRIELENGFVLWTRAGSLIRERGRKTLGRAAGGESGRSTCGRVLANPAARPARAVGWAWASRC